MPTLPVKRPTDSITERDGCIDGRSMLVGFALALFLLPAYAFWNLFAEHEIAEQEFEYQVDETAAQQERELLLHRARQAVQEHFFQAGEVPVALAGDHPAGNCGLTSEQLTGRHYVIVNVIEKLGTGELQVVAVPLVGDYPLVRMRFLPSDSAGEIVVEPHPKDS